MILLIDNYDSFVHNLARYIGMQGYARTIIRNDALTLADVAAMQPEAIILSPGPCAPAQAGICLPLVREFYQTVPILGICLGHQCIGEAFGARTTRARRPMHGKASVIEHGGDDLFERVPTPFRAGRYHSLIVEPPVTWPLLITAQVAAEETIMALAHKAFPLRGLQFHPESILTEHGPQILKNFLNLAEGWNEQRRGAA